MISALEWVPRGVADPTPKIYELSKAERELLEQQANMEAKLDDNDVDWETDEEQEETVLPKVDPKSLPAELRMDEYSDDEENDAVQGSAVGSMLVGTELSEMGDDGMPVEEEEEEEEEGEDDEEKDEDVQIETAIRGENDDMDSSDEDNDDDDDLADVPDTREYMPVDVEGLEAMGLSAVGNSGMLNLEDGEGNEDDDSDVDDVNLSPDDAILVVAKTEEDFASLEVHVYEQKTGNLFVHHDIPLPSFPLCLAHGDINCEGGAGNYCAVGTFSPGIEVWNLDVLNALEPSFILGGEDTTAADELMKLNMARAASGKKMKKKRFQHTGLRPGSHTDAVLSLSWSKVHRQVVASGSADCTVKLWDVTKAGDAKGQTNVATFGHHKDKIQSVVWHPTEGTLLATGSYDRTVALLDARSSDQSAKKVKITADCESLKWDPHNPQYLTAASEDGVITCWDVRKFESGEPLWSFVAEEYGGVTDLAYNPNVPGFLATCAINKTVTLWDTYTNGEPSLAQPTPCGSKDMNVGKLYTLNFYPSSPWLLGCGGGGNMVALWDMTREAPIRNRFGDRVKGDVNFSLDNEDDSPPPQEDFEAMMAAEEQALEKVREKAQKNKKKKGKGKKKKVHRKGR